MMRSVLSRSAAVVGSCLLLSAAVPSASAQQPVAVPTGPACAHDIRPGPGVTATKKLSAWLPSLTGTPGDTDVYVLEGKQSGGTVFVAGGTHANEVSGIMAATVLVEHARVEQGRLIVVPHANNSAVAWIDPAHPGADGITLKTASGERRFKLGSRLTKPQDQGEPDPAKYRHPASSEQLEGVESRNLDRAHPGRADGNLTQRIAFAMGQLLKAENVDVAFDFHEAGPESRLAWMIVANPKNIDLGASATLALETAGVEMKLERSSDTFRGLSHREWGDATRAMSFLFETPNPGQGSGGARADLVNDAKLPLARRVAVHLAAMSAIVDGFDEEAPPSHVVRLSGVPALDEMTKAGVGAFLK